MTSLETGSLNDEVPSYYKSMYGKIESNFSTTEEIERQHSLNSEILYSTKKEFFIQPVIVNNLKKKWWKYLILIIIIGVLIFEIYYKFFLNYVYTHVKVKYDKGGYYYIVEESGKNVNVLREFLGMPKQPRSKNDVDSLLIEVMESYEKEFINMKQKEQSNVIVSFTTYPKRYKYVPYVIYSIIKNKIAPEKIIINLATADIPFLTPELKEIIQKGYVELIECTEDLKPHNKFFYAMKKYRNNPIITIDDDHLYPNTLIEELLASYKKYPKSISARQVKTKKFESNGSLAYYRTWEETAKAGSPPSFIYYAQGVGGVLYPPSIFDFNDKDLEIMRKYVTVDDTTLNYFQILLGIKTVYCPTNCIGMLFYEAQKDGMCKKVNNNHLQNIQFKSKNDIAAEDLLYPVHKKLKKEDYSN